MMMIPGGGTTVFSSSPLCRARDICFFLPLVCFRSFYAVTQANLPFPVSILIHSSLYSPSLFFSYSSLSVMSPLFYSLSLFFLSFFRLFHSPVSLFWFLSFPLLPLPLSLLPLYIYSQAERESPLPCSIKTQEGNEATLPLQGKVAGCLQGMGCINGGRVKGMAMSGFCGQVGWRERVGKNFKNLLLPCLCMRREEGEQCRSKQHCFSFFFFHEKEM